jgi:hypothetical protein
MYVLCKAAGNITDVVSLRGPVKLVLFCDGIFYTVSQPEKLLLLLWLNTVFRKAAGKIVINVVTEHCVP